MNPAFYAMAMLPLAGWLLARPRARSRGAHPLQIALGDAFVIALLATFLLNILVAYKGYLQHGLYAGWQPRYFLFAVPATWFIMTLVKPAPLIRVAILGAFAIAACISFRSEEHTSELQSLMRISYAVLCLKKKKQVINLTPI